MIMRTTLWVTTLLVVVAMATARSAGGKKKNGQDCGEWTYGACEPKKGSCGPGKKPGNRTGENCRLKERNFRCVVPCENNEHGPVDLASMSRGRDGRRKNKQVPCRYERAPWGDCDVSTGVRTRTMNLKRGDESCEKTKTETKKCKAAPEACKYQRTEWSECDTNSNTRTRSLSLKRGDATKCEPTKIETKACKKTGGAQHCKYERASNTTRNMQCADGKMAITLTLKSGDPSTCEATKVKTKSCRQRSRRAVGRCRYQRGDWSMCDPTTNTKTRTNTLKRANPACEATKVETKRCRASKSSCRYDKGEWGECNAESKQSRTDKLKSDNSDPSCQATRTIERRCKNKCKYNFGTWSDCTDGKRIRTKTLISGDSSLCQPTKSIEKRCRRDGRKGRCEFSAWGPFGECINGVRTKRRTVTRGGPDSDCQRRAVRTKPCKV